MRSERRRSHAQIAGAGLLVVTVTLGLGAQERYADPVVFQRAHLEEATGKEVLRSKLWVMEADGSGLRQLTVGTTYDDHPSFYADQEHVLFAEFPTNTLNPSGTARLIKLNIYSGHRETVAAVHGCALHHATLSPIDDLLAYQRDCGARRSQWVGFGPEAYEVSLLATNGVRTRTSIIAMHEKNQGLSPREVALVSVTGHGAGSVVRALTDDAALHRRPAVSPDEQWLAWQTNTEGGVTRSTWLTSTGARRGTSRRRRVTTAIRGSHATGPGLFSNRIGREAGRSGAWSSRPELSGS